MMKVNLICSKVIEKTVKNLLQKKGFIIERGANIVFIQKGLELPEQEALFIVFDLEDLSNLILFLDEIELEKRGVNGIIGKNKCNYELILYDEIAYFEADGNYVYFITISGDRYEVKEKLYQLEEDLNKEMFIRVNKSNIINILNIGEICPYFKGELIVKFSDLEKEIVVTRNYSKRFKSFLGI